MNNVVQLRPNDPESSTVELELEALDRQLRTIEMELNNVTAWDDEAGRDYAIMMAYRALNIAIQRSYRAKQISRGIRVNIPR